MEPPSSTFCSLATELVELAADRLQADDILALRLTCRDIQEKTFHLFCCRFFSCLRTDLSHSSLVRINALSKHRQFRPYVQGLAFVLGKGVGRDISWDRHPWGPLSSPVQTQAVRTLRDNLVHSLVRCRSFSVICRYPEGRPGFDHLTVSDAVAVFFAIIADCHLPVKSFHLLYSSDRPRPLSMDMRRLPPLLPRQPGFLAAWSHLQELSVQQYSTLESFPFLLDLILNAPNLRVLRLTLSLHDLSAGFIYELASSGSLPQIQDLSLSRTSVRADDLRALLRRLGSSLRALRLHDVSNVSDHWEPVFEELKSGFPSLHFLSFCCLRLGSSSSRFLTFPALGKTFSASGVPGQARLHYSDGLSDPAGLEYTGTASSEVLGSLQGEASI